MVEELQKLPVADLRKLLKEAGQPTSGNKKELAERLFEAQQEAAKEHSKRPREEEQKEKGDPAPSVAPSTTGESAAKRSTRSGDPKAEKAFEWQTEESLRVLCPKGLVSRGEILAFDMDDTLITTKSGKVFAQGRSDWKWLYDSIPAKLRDAHSNGKKIIIFTNQAGIDGKGGFDVSKERMILGKIEDIIQELAIPIQVFVATTDDKFRKPEITMWELMVKSYNDGIVPDVSKSMFVGDAAGRPSNPKGKKDFSCSDRKFAYNIGIAFKTPEEFFLNESPAAFNWDAVDLTKIPREGEVCTGGIASLTSPKQEMIIMVAFPASGKSTFCKTHLVPKGYVHVNRDTLKTPARCLNAAREAITAGKSVVIDNTNPDVASRAEYIEIAKEHNVPVRCFWMQVDELLAQHLNYFRERLGYCDHIPHIAYNVFKKKYTEPKLSEGFTEIKPIKFIANNFPDENAKKLFFQLH